MFRDFWKNVSDTLKEKKETDLNADVAKMSAYINKNYPPAMRVVLLESIQRNVIGDFKRSIQMAEKTKEENMKALKQLEAV